MTQPDPSADHAHDRNGSKALAFENQEAEALLLGSLCLLEPSRARALLDRIPPQALTPFHLKPFDIAPWQWENLKAEAPPLFSDQNHQVIFEVMRSLAVLQKRPLDLIVVGDELERLGYYEGIGGPAKLAGLEENVGSTLWAGECLRIVLDKWKIRTIIMIQGQFVEDIRSDPSTTDSIMNRSAHRVAEVVTIGSAEPLPITLKLKDFMAVEHPDIRWIIEGLFPAAARMTLSAPAKWGKSWWATQMAIAMSSGHCEWLGMKFGPSCRVLYVQPEMSDVLMQLRLRRLGETMPPQFDADTVDQNFHVMTTSEVRPNLNFNSPGRRDLELTIQKLKPDVVILDPLAFLFPGLDENTTEGMGGALDYIDELREKFSVAILLLHHTGKSGLGARGHSIFAGWQDFGLYGSFTDPDSKDVAKITSDSRWGWLPSPLYWKLQSEEDPWLAVMPEGWQPEKTGKGVNVEPAAVAQHLRDALKFRGLAFLRTRELIDVLINRMGANKTSAKASIDKAKDLGAIVEGVRGQWINKVD